MDVKTVCLGMLSDGAATGYDLKKQFESSFAHFFAAGYGSIYPALSSLADDGLVSCEHVPQDGKPDRKVYAITDSGMEYLRKALHNSTPSHKVRSEFLAMMCFSHLMQREQIEAVLDHQVREVDEFLKIIAEIESKCGHRWLPGMRFVAGFGKAMTTTLRQYVQDHRHLLVDDDVTRDVQRNIAR